MKQAAPGAALICLLWLGGLGPAAAQYVPTLTVVRSVDSFHVLQNGEFTHLLERDLRIDTQQGVGQEGEQQLSFNSKLETLEILEAYTLQADGTRVNVPEDKIVTKDGDDAAVYSDDKLRVIIYPKVEVGSRLVVKARAVQRTPVFPGHFVWSHYFSPHYAYKELVLNLTHEPGINLRASTDGVQGGKLPAQPGDAPGMGRYSFSFRQAQAHPREANQVAFSDFAPHIALSSFASYADYAQAYQARAKPMAAVTPEIAKLARDLTAGATDERDKVRRLYNWVSRNIRYVAVYAGAGGWVPHSAASVLENLYGDCKDHVTLLEALLEAVGIASSPALINSSDANRLPLIPTDEPFNHVITYLPSLDLYLDSTSQFTPMGRLPAGDLDKPVVLTATGTLGRTPATHAERDYTHTQTTLRLLEDGRISGSSSARMNGFFEVASRASHFSYQGRDQAEWVNQTLSRFSESGSGENQPNRPLDLDTPWVLEAVFELDALVNLPGPSAMTIPVGLAPGRIKSGAKKQTPLARRFPYECSALRHTELTTLELPGNAQVERIPSNVQFQSGPLSYAASYLLEGSVLKISRDYTARHTKSVCNSQDDVHWSAMREVLQRDLRGQVFFK
jgi:transglutaminase-like putative cysteine protease